MYPPAPNLKAIFAAALDHPAGPERSAYLDAACGAAGPLRLQVDALLRAHEGAGQFLDSAADPTAATAAADFVLAPGPGTLDFTPAPAGATLTAPDPAAPRPDLGPAEGLGAVIGPYKLLQAIGEGGMGTVFMAEQDRPIRRKVALKVIKAGMDTRLVVARFEAERQALALMDHPNIARVLDAGATATGRPYFVMELVRGVPITEYCDKNHLTPRERLELFLPVCRAIQHAHQKGIIHRDIKPTNVLVTLHDGVPEPKVIDFGVAKAIEQRLTERTMFTEFGAIVGTLEYMSPEQAEMGALDIDTRSDIYSLGVLLYELLTGSTPLDKARLRQAAYSEILRRIREEEPHKPSTKLSESKDALPSISAQRKTEPARLPGLMRGDLDWIVMKSLDKDRTRRYETANGFARDIQRHLDGDAVEASPPSARYKLAKFARNHRAALATAAAFATLLLLATATSAGLAFWANKERLRATRAERSAREQQGRAEGSAVLAKQQQARALEREGMAIDAVRRFGDVVRDTPELKNNPALEGLRKKLLREPQDFFRKLRDQFQGDRDTTPESLAQLGSACYDLGKSSAEVDSKEDALAAFEQSRFVRERLARADPASARFQADLAWSCSAIGTLQRGAERYADALTTYGRACKLWERLIRDDTSNLLYQDQLCWDRANIAAIQGETGHPVEALAMFEQLATDRARIARAVPANPDFQSNLAHSQMDVGMSQYQMGQHDKALKTSEQARVICEQLVRDYPSNLYYLHELSKCLDHIGLSQAVLGRPTESLASLERAVAIGERLVRDNPTVTDYQSELARMLTNFAKFQHDLGRPTESLASLERAVAIGERLVRDNPTVPRSYSFLAWSLNNIVSTLSEMGRLSEAAAARVRLRAVQAEVDAKDPAKVARKARLAEVLAGAAPRGDAERLELAYLASMLGRPVGAARLFAAALASDPQLAADRRGQHAYNAACAAALAAWGQGGGEPSPDEAARAELRRQALGWLRAELAEWTRILDGGPAEAKAMIPATLAHWKEDADLAGIHVAAELAKLPEAERAEFARLWADVDALLARAKGEQAASTATPAAAKP